MTQLPGRIAAAIAAACITWVGPVNASLVGDIVTVGHYFPDGVSAMPGATPPSSFAAAAGNADLYTFYNSYPFGYTVNVEAASILVDFSYVIQPGLTATWEHETSICVFPAGCSTVPASFNGLRVSDLNDSTGNALQSVLVTTNMSGWSTSRLSFGNDSVQFDWRGLSFDRDTRLTATLEFGSVTAPIPEPETYAMLLAGLGLLGFAARRRKLKEAAAA